MPTQLPTKLTRYEVNDSSNDSFDYTATYTKDDDGYLTTVKIKEVHKHTNDLNTVEEETTSYTYTLTWE